MSEASPFFVTGGTLPANARSYVARQADRELFEALQSGAFCYVLNTRQVGKSSLMIRTAHALREQGVTTVVLDITAGGFNLTPEAWYDGLLLQLSEQLARFLGRPELEDTLEEAFAARSQLGVAQRFFHVLEQLALPAAGEQGLVVFVDEIDAVRLLPFAVDELFVGIRAFYNRRAERPELAKLTFCLVGVATPNQLIENPLVSPFNIGKKITLTDFTLTEALPLAASLPGGESTLARVLHWTGGHPYLTQRLCARLVEHGESVDATVEGLFFTHAARESDDNLAFVATRLLRSEDDTAALLELYGRVRAGKSVADDPTVPLQDTLHLAGLVRTQPDGKLAVRNRIYERVFDQAWVRENLPDGEVRRQRAAFRRGALRTGGLAGGVLTAMGGLTAWALLNARRADDAATRADREAGSALRAQRASEENRKLAQKNQARAEKNQARAEQLAQERARALTEKEQALREKEQALKAKESALHEREAALAAEKTARGLADRATKDAQINLGRVELALALRALGNAEPEAAAEHLAAALQQGKLSPEQTQLAQFCQQTIATCAPRLLRKIVCRGTPTATLFSPDGRRLAVGTGNGWVQVFESATGKPLSPAYPHGAGITSLAFLRGECLASGGNDSRIHLWGPGMPTKPLVHTVQSAPIHHLAPSRDGSKLISSGRGGCVVWETRTGREISRVWDDDMGGRWTADKDTRIPHALVARFSNPQETQLAFGAYGYVCNIADVATGQMLRPFSTAQNKAAGPDWAYQFVPTHTPGVIAVIGHYTDGTGNACLYNLETGRSVSPLMVPTNSVTRCGSFSPDGTTLAVGDEAGSLLLWEPASKRPAEGPFSLFPPQHFVHQVAWLPDNDRLLAQTMGDPVVLWSKSEKRIVTARFRNSRGFALSPIQSTVAITGADSILALWSIPPRRSAQVIRIHTSNNGLNEEQVSKDGYAWLSWLDTPLENSVVIDLETRRILQSSQISLSWSPEGRYIAIHDTSCAVVWDTVQQVRVGRTTVQTAPRAHIQWEKARALFVRQDGLTESIPLTPQKK